MPVPQEMNFIVEQASCLFLTMVQDVSFIRLTTAILYRFRLHQYCSNVQKVCWRESIILVNSKQSTIMRRATGIDIRQFS